MSTEQIAAGGLRLTVQRAGDRPARVLWLTEDAPPPEQVAAASALLDGAGLLLARLPGLGGSERRGPYGVTAAAEAVAALVTRESVAPLDLVGHGLGGAVAFTLAAARPELVGRLALVSGPVPGGPGARRYAGYLVSRRLPLGYARSLLEPAGELGPRLGGALVVWGSADRVLPQSVGEAIHRRLAQGRPPGWAATSIVPGGGHDLPRTAPDVLWGRVAGFLAAT